MTAAQVLAGVTRFPRRAAERMATGVFSRVYGAIGQPSGRFGRALPRRKLRAGSGTSRCCRDGSALISGQSLLASAPCAGSLHCCHRRLRWRPRFAPSKRLVREPLATKLSTKVRAPASSAIASLMPSFCGTLACSRLSARPMPGNVRAGEELRRRVELVEQLLDDAADQVLAEVRDLGVLVDAEHAVRLPHARLDRVPVVRVERAEVDDLDVDAVGRELLGGGERTSARCGRT